MLQGRYHTPLSIDVHMVLPGRRDVCLGLRRCLVPLAVGTPRAIQSNLNLPCPLDGCLRATWGRIRGSRVAREAGSSRAQLPAWQVGVGMGSREGGTPGWGRWNLEPRQ